MGNTYFCYPLSRFPTIAYIAIIAHLFCRAVSGSTARYLPFGGWRTEPTAGLTARGYTGHRHNNLGSTPEGIGLIYMAARWYSPTLGRFISAATVVPDPANPQSYNRYSYVENRTIRYTDPSGHMTCEDMPWECDNEGNWSDDGTRSKMSASGALVAYCAISDLACSGSGIGYIDINLSFLSNLAGYDPGVVSLPCHINPDYANPDSLFPWEGVADVAYAEHSSLHPANYPEGSDEWNSFVDHWLGEAIGIMQTMINRAEEPGYETANHAALNNGKFGQYAYPGRKINDNLGIYQEFYGLAFMVIQLDVRVGQPYKSFAHQDLSDLRGRSPTGTLNDVLYTDTARFGAWGDRKFWAVPG
ncbi:MAG: RHS repeat-associated core domain-containing protein, partial [Anaerolineales bacterium]|nr:RHS repeat-associated core domain-containing protein [Anaerolineales bacterium]